MSVSIDGSWRKDVLDQMKRAKSSVFQLASSKKWNFIVALLDDYNEAAALAMGSVNARGGYPYIEFRGYKAKDVEDWKKLSYWTVAFKNGEDTEDLIHADNEYRGKELQAAWDLYADSTYIWEYEGTTQESLHADYRKGTAGVTGAAFSYASLLEEGGTGDWNTKNGAAEIPARPLFGPLNQAFRDYIHEQLRNRHSDLYMAIQREFKARMQWK